MPTIGRKDEMTNPDVDRQAAANAEAQKQFEAERQRKNTIQAAAKALRLKAADLDKANSAIRKEMASFKEICNADILELVTNNEALTLEGTELRNKLALLKKTAGVA